LAEKYQFPLLSRDDGLALIHAKLGYKVSKTKLEADCAQGRGPKPAAQFGRKLLYEADAFLQWGESLIKAPQSMPAGPGRPRKAE
jgi:hypothetical protein